MGAWIGGLFTYEAIRMVADKGYALSIITPGLNKPEIWKAIKTLGPQFDQVILGGYPPFIKDVIDEGIKEGINWKKYNLGIIFSAEGFTEKFRDYITKQAGLKDIYTSTLNHYGTVDQGTHAHETPLAILIRRLAQKNSTFHKSVFPEPGRLPTLAQYLPELFYFEEVSGGLLCSAFSGIPLVRYDLKDRGGILSYAEMERRFGLGKGAKKVRIQNTLWRLPFVYVYERSDMVVSWYGANIYPEHVREAHLNDLITKYFTGKFAMSVVYDKKHDPVLEIHSELRKGLKPNPRMTKQLTDVLVQTLLRKNSEYRNNYSSLPHKNVPKVRLWHHESAPHFKGGGKQKWVIK
jgi:phenylacetate-CoA ligase